MAPLVVLLADSSPIFMQGVTRFLADHAPGQFLVCGALGPEGDVLALATSLRPAVVLLGLGSSAQPGLQLLPHLRAALPGAAIIVLGVVEANGYRQAAHASGADAFLIKDDVSTTLLRTLADVLRSRSAD